MDGAGLRSTWERDGDRSDKVDDVDPVSLLAVFERCTEVFESYGHRIGYVAKTEYLYSISNPVRNRTPGRGNRTQINNGVLYQFSCLAFWQLLCNVLSSWSSELVELPPAA
jgi:hypothetical protein